MKGAKLSACQFFAGPAFLFFNGRKTTCTALHYCGEVILTASFTRSFASFQHELGILFAFVRIGPPFALRIQVFAFYMFGMEVKGFPRGCDQFPVFYRPSFPLDGIVRLTPIIIGTRRFFHCGTHHC